MLVKFFFQSQAIISIFEAFFSAVDSCPPNNRVSISTIYLCCITCIFSFSVLEKNCNDLYLYSFLLDLLIFSFVIKEPVFLHSEILWTQANFIGQILFRCFFCNLKLINLSIKSKKSINIDFSQLFHMNFEFNFVFYMFKLIFKIFHLCGPMHRLLTVHCLLQVNLIVHHK